MAVRVCSVFRGGLAVGNRAGHQDQKSEIRNHHGPPCQGCRRPRSVIRNQNSSLRSLSGVLDTKIRNKKSEFIMALTVRRAGDQDQKSEIRIHRGAHCQECRRPRSEIRNQNSPWRSLSGVPGTKIRNQKSEIIVALPVRSAGDKDQNSEFRGGG